MSEEQTYREPGKSDTLVMCPRCERPVESGGEQSVCRHCETRFATQDATTLVAYNAAKQLARVLEPTPAVRGMSARTRWTITLGIMGAAVGAGFAFGSLGALVGFGAIAIFWAVAMSATRVDPLR